MPTQHTLVPVGMMGVQTAPTYLQGDLQKIYQGDTNYNPEACNAVHTYQDFYAYGPGEKFERAIAQYKSLVQKASAASNGRMKCLVADFTQKKTVDGGGNHNYFFDGMPAASMTPNLQTVTDFMAGTDNVVGFMDEIMNNNLTDNVLGWFLADEVRDTCGTTTKPSLSHFTSICQAAHNAQVANQNWPNKPFYIVIPMDANWAAGNQSLNFASYVDPWVNAVTNTVGADVVIMMDFYPWLATAEDFRFSQYPAVEAIRSPLRRWWKFIHDTNARYTSNSRVVGVHAVLQAHRLDANGNVHPDVYRMPSHADMHQQIRAVRNFMAETGSKPAGVWLWEWGKGASLNPPTANNDVLAWKRWSQSGTERWAEAVQNEIDNQTEGITDAIPTSSTVLQAIPAVFPPYNRATKVGGTWLTFHLHQRGKVEFTIKLGVTEKRRLSWECNYNSVQQKAVNSVSCNPGQANKLGATAIFFDGKDNCGNDLPGGPGGTVYTCQMLVNGSPVGCTISFTITAP